MITCSVTLDVPHSLVRYVAALLQVDRRKRGTRRGRRAPTPFRQAVLVLRWFRQDAPFTALARNAGIPIHRWCSGKHRRFGANVQFVATADEFPLSASDALPGSTHDLTAARTYRITGALYAAAAQGLVTLADQGYQGTGIHTPTKTPASGITLDVDIVYRNTLLAGLRCLGERAAALLTTRWKPLDRITLCPNRIGSIVRATLALTQFEHAGRY